MWKCTAHRSVNDNELMRLSKSQEMRLRGNLGQVLRLSTQRILLLRISSLSSLNISLASVMCQMIFCIGLGVLR